MSTADRLEKLRPGLDRQVVEEIVVPLAFFIHDREQPEPLDALRARAEFFREIVDKLVASGDPFNRTAEAIKPLLRRSVEQARPLTRERFPYLSAPIESLKPFEVHRATALAHMFETVLKPDLDEQALQAVEQNIRLNKTQYHVYVQLTRAYPRLISVLQPLDRIQPTDAEFLLKFLQEFEPTPEAVENMVRRLGYLPPVETDSDDPQTLMRAIAVLCLPRLELTSWQFLYSPSPPSPEELSVLAKTVVAQFRPTGIGAYDRQALIGAVPVPVDLSKALAGSGYQPTDDKRLDHFRDEIRRLIETGGATELSRALQLLRKFRRAVEQERVAKGLVIRDGVPYVGEVWLKKSGEMVGLLFYEGTGFGEVPIEQMVRRPAGGNHAEVEQALHRQLKNQALIYQAFHKLFSIERELPLREDRAQSSRTSRPSEKRPLTPSAHGGVRRHDPRGGSGISCGGGKRGSNPHRAQSQSRSGDHWSRQDVFP
jgi:hypothetical protein